MPDKKITDLVDGDPLQPTDEFVVARAGDNFKIDGSAVVAAVTKHDVTLAGNTAGALALISSGTLTLAGGNNITLSQAGNAVTISGGAAGGTSIGGISASNTLYTSGTVRFTGSQAVTVRSGTGQLVVIDAPAQTTQTQGVLSVGASTGGNTSGNTTVNTGSRLVFAGGNNITISQGTAAGATTLTISGPNVGGAQTGISGIANSETTYTSGSVTLSALGAVTIRSTTGQHFQISVNSQTAQTGISGIANSQTTYSSGTVSLSELGAITIRSTTGNQYQLSVNAQTTQTQGILSAGVSTGGNTLGNTTVNTGSRLVFVGSGNLTASQGTAAGASTITLSVAAQTTQTQGILSAGVSTGGATSGNTTVNTGSRLVFVGTNITLSQGTAAAASTITVSAPATSSLSATGIVSLSTNGSTISVGAPGYSGGMSTNGNTSGDTGFASQRLALIGGNNITLSGSTNGGSMSITVSAPNLGAGAMSAGASNLGNTAGSTGITGTQLVLVGSNNITLSQSTGANGGTLSIIGGGGGGFSGGVSTGGNTLGSTGVTGTRLVFVGTGEITLSQSTDANGGTVSISNAPNGTISQWPQPMSLQGAATLPDNFASGATRTTLSLNVWPMAVDRFVTGNRVRMFASMTNSSTASNTTYSGTYGASFGIYSLTGGTLSLISSFSHQQRLSYNSAANSTNASATWQASWGSGTDLSSSRSLSTANAGVAGFWQRIGSAKAWDLGTGQVSISPGQYWGMYGWSSSTVGSKLWDVVSVYGNAVVTASQFQDVGADIVSSNANYPLMGYVTATQTDTALPATVATANVVTATNNAATLRKSHWVQIITVIT